MDHNGRKRRKVQGAFFFFSLLMMLCKINEHRKYLLALHHAGLQLESLGFSNYIQNKMLSKEDSSFSTKKAAEWSLQSWAGIVHHKAPRTGAMLCTGGSSKQWGAGWLKGPAPGLSTGKHIQGKLRIPIQEGTHICVYLRPYSKQPINLCLSPPAFI